MMAYVYCILLFGRAEIGVTTMMLWKRLGGEDDIQETIGFGARQMECGG